MAELFLTLLALIPFVILLFLIVLKRVPAIYAMPFTWLITLLIVLFFWQIPIILTLASFIKGTFIAIEIMLIIFGAIFFIQILKEKNQIKNLQSSLAFISEDARIQAIIIAFLFGALIEGIAGFGTPAALAAPLLVSIGFTPLLAIVLSLIANSTPVSFGAAGTPILLGLGGLGFEKDVLLEITKNTAIIHSIASFIIPIILVALVVFNLEKKDKFKKISETIPFAIFAWLSFIIPYLIVAIFIGPELPAIIAGFLSLIIIGTSAHYGFLVPKNKIILKKSKKKLSLKKMTMVLSPYLIIIVLLTLSRIIQPLKEILISIPLSWTNILNTNLNYTFLPFFTPSFYFFISALFCIFIFRANLKETSSAFLKSLNKIKTPLIALIFALALVQLLLISEIPLTLASSLSNLNKELFILLSPFIGALGSFITGSNTVSNLLFGSFQFETAKSLGLPIILILALQVVGGAIGNMIAIHNVLAAQATVGLKGQEGTIIRKTIIVSLIYGLIAGIIGIIIFSF
tara:strand:- start:2024 stop:3571 length:1548 start_codon:yes stop_codon:yes gene_type:complete